jgi:hypothetical protein
LAKSACSLATQHLHLSFAQKRGGARERRPLLRFLLTRGSRELRADIPVDAVIPEHSSTKQTARLKGSRRGRRPGPLD